VKSNKLLL